jgi:hypothetical protein
MLIHASEAQYLSLLFISHAIRASVSSALFPASRHCAVEITKNCSRGLRLLYEEFGIAGLAAELSGSRAHGRSCPVHIEVNALTSRLSRVEPIVKLESGRMRGGIHKPFALQLLRQSLKPSFSEAIMEAIIIL